MNTKSLNPKLILGAVYLIIISTGLYFLLSAVDIKDLMSYEFIKSNKDVILEYKDNNFLFLTLTFFLFSVIWVLLLGFAMPLLIFSGFVFGKWWGILIVLTATTAGATLLYWLVSFFFRDMIKEKLATKFFNLKNFFIKNDILYFTIFRFIGGGGAPYAVQNVLPVLFDMPLKNYIIATFIGSPPMNIIECDIINKNNQTMIKLDENIIVNPKGQINCKVTAVERLGNVSYIYSEGTLGNTITIEQPKLTKIKTNEMVTFSPDPEYLYLFDKSGERL